MMKSINAFEKRITDILDRSKAVGIILNPETENEIAVFPKGDKQLCHEIAIALRAFYRRYESD